MADFDQVIFDKKSLGDLLKEIHIRNNSKEKQITGLISQLKDMITNIQDATILVPLVKGYVDASIKNDDILVKMTSIIQNNVSKNKTVEESSLSEEERDQLLALAQQAMVDKNSENLGGQA